MQLIIQDSIISLPINFLTQELDELCFLRCQFVGESEFITNKHCENIVLLESSSQLKKINFNNTFNYESVIFLTSNNFDETEIDFSGILKSVKFDSAEWSHARYIPELRQSADKSNYGIIRVGNGTTIEKLYIDTANILKSIKFTGTSKQFSIRNVQANDDVTIIPESNTKINIDNITTKQLAFTGSFESITISGDNHISSLSFKLDCEINKSLNIDLANTHIDYELKFSNSSDPKLTKCEISNICYSKIKRLTFYKCQMSCFSLANCDLSKTYIVFKHCKIDDLNTEGVIWPYEINSSHFNYKADDITELHQSQSIYRQLKSISHKNKDIDSFLLFRQREYESMSQLSLFRTKTLIVYFSIIITDLLKIRTNMQLPEITHRRYNNKMAMFIYETTSYFILKTSSILSAHNTSLFRPIIFLVLGTPVFLYLFDYYCSIEQLVQLSAHIINPTHKDEITINGKNILISPVHSLFFRVYSSILLYKIIISFRRYSNI